MVLNKVFEPLQIKSLHLENRLVVSAMSSHLGNEDGTPNEAVYAYLKAKISGGWGLVFTEDLGVTHDAGCDPVVGSLWNDDQIPAWRELVSRIHHDGGKIAAQIYHAGRERTLGVYPTHPVAPSAVKEPTMSYVPRELSVSEIHDLVYAFGECARRCILCGFDMIEIHGAHGYLVNEFMSPFANKRNDMYGGTLINRMRFPIEIVKEIRRVVGEDYPICFRMNTCDYVDGGIELPEAVVMAKMLEQAGVDVLHCSQGMYASKEHIISPGHIPMANYMNHVEAVKKAVGIPVIAVGRFNDIFMAQAALEEGKADLIAMARASLADPELPRKAKEGRLEEIIHCIGCDQGCTGEAAVGGKVNCLVNPHTARELAYDYSKVACPKKVLVAGGGVSGLSAAIAAGERGHKVTLYEASGELGGQWIAAAIPPGKTEYNALLFYYRQQIEKYHIQVILNTPLTREIAEKEKPDAVILATGSKPLYPPIKGLDNQSMVKSALDILRGRETFGKRVLVVGSGLTGAESAVFLAINGCEVYLMEMQPDIIPDAVSQTKACLKASLKKYGIKILTNTKLVEVGEEIVYASHYDESVTLSHIDTVVNALGVRSYNPLEKELAESDIKVVVAGDARKTKNGYRNIREGFEAGNMI